MREQGRLSGRVVYACATLFTIVFVHIKAESLPNDPALLHWMLCELVAEEDKLRLLIQP